MRLSPMHLSPLLFIVFLLAVAIIQDVSGAEVAEVNSSGKADKKKQKDSDGTESTDLIIFDDGPSMASVCGGDMYIPVPEIIETQSFCGGKPDIVRNGLIDIFAKLAETPLRTPGALFLIVAKAGMDMICGPEEETPTDIYLESLVTEAKYEISQTFKAQIVSQMETYAFNVDALKQHGATLNELYETAQKYFDLVWTNAQHITGIGVIGAQIATNAAMYSDLYTLAVNEAADELNETACCQAAADRLIFQRCKFQSFYKTMKDDFNNYREESLNQLNPRIWKEDRGKPWFCAWGVWTWQWKITAVGNNGEEIGHAWSPAGVGFWCPSDEEQKQKARNIVKPKVEAHFDNLYDEIFHPGLVDWYENLNATVAWKCGGQAYVPKDCPK